MYMLHTSSRAISSLSEFIMGQIKFLMVFICLLGNEICESTAYKILYVLPDNSTNTSCTHQPCTTLSQYLLDDGTLSDVVNVEYHFLPGEHQVPANMVLKNLHNFSIVGIVDKSSLQVVLVGCVHSHVLKIHASHYVNIRNVLFKRCYHSQLQSHIYLTSLYLSWCFSCVLENVTFINFGILGEDLIGNSYWNGIYITHNTGQFCQGIVLVYKDDGLLTDKNEYYLLLNEIHITEMGNESKCFIINDYFTAGLCLYVYRSATNGTILISNSMFKRIHNTALYIKSTCPTHKSIISLNSCVFHSIISLNQAVVQAELSDNNKVISFNNCTFKNNYAKHVVAIRIHTKMTSICRSILVNQTVTSSSRVFFREGQFILNKGQILLVRGNRNKQNISIIGPIIIKNNLAMPEHYNDLIEFQNMVVYMHGPVTISYNYAANHGILLFVTSEVLFYGGIIFKQNQCYQIISLSEYAYIKLMEYTNMVFIYNKCRNKLIEISKESDFRNNFCLFQYMTFSNKSTASINNYAINVIHTSKKCSFMYHHFTPNCQFLPNAAFHSYNSETINHQIIHIDDQQLNYHMICLCYDNGTYDCSRNVLGPVYPGQVLQLHLCTPCSDETFILYTETYDSLQINTSCRINNPAEILNTISNYSKLINYTIVSEAPNTCKLFLTISSYQQLYAYEVYHVKLLPCPVGFTLQDGICDCDFILTKFLVSCNIDQPAIRRPANTWLTAYNQTQNTKYLISHCPMDYCLPYSSYVNLLYPDLQCQYNRTGVLCSQCQQPLSMVLGSSRCMECTNIHILISIIVIVAGIVLVVLLYLLNLTVTKGTVNGIILYANIISINDSYFLINNNVFKPLQLFISFTNLDLGIETCFYHGMDSYAKMWLQLFFSFYLVVIASSIIIASRYSSRILRLTFSRSLPVLATLFLLSYTSVLRTVSTVLFSYSTITHLPSGHHQMVWSIDASVPLFGIKFTILFIASLLVLFLILIPFNIILLFTRYLSKFRMINRFKPLLDAFQGSYKDKYYYWVAVNIILRSLFFALYGLNSKLRLLIATMILVVFATCQCYIRPNKIKVVNIHELLLLINLTITYAVSYYSSSNIFSLVTNIMISLAFIQFSTIVLYHFLTYTCHLNVLTTLHTLRENAMRCCGSRLDNHLNDIALLDINKNTYNYNEYQD